MEVILKESIRPLMGVHQQGEIALCVSNHSIRIHYIDGGRYLDCTVDGHAQEYHDLDGVYQRINAVAGSTENKEILLSNEPQSTYWKGIRLHDEEIRDTIRNSVLFSEINPRHKGYGYFLDVLHILCKHHIAGQVVDIADVLCQVADRYGITRPALEYTIKAALCRQNLYRGYLYERYNRQTPQKGNSLFFPHGYTVRLFALDYVHDLLDAMAGKEKTMNKDLKEEFERAFVAMPPQMQETVIWVIRHFDIVKTLAKYEPMSDDKLDVFAKSSLEKGEYFLFITAEYAKLLRKEERAGISTSEGNDSSTSLSGLLP
ncbi:MAG TPA: hypothetical protein H9694_07270 [Firmicutes bacterium]|nr:hypothetical protein [Bacillota bacterium]